jgi:hypothetical protein
MWEEGDSYLRNIQEADLGTEEAADWVALNHAAKTMADVWYVKVKSGPKAQPRAIRPLRLSVGGARS